MAGPSQISASNTCRRGGNWFRTGNGCPRSGPAGVVRSGVWRPSRGVHPHHGGTRRRARRALVAVVHRRRDTASATLPVPRRRGLIGARFGAPVSLLVPPFRRRRRRPSRRVALAVGSRVVCAGRERTVSQPPTAADGSLTNLFDRDRAFETGVVDDDEQNRQHPSQSSERDRPVPLILRRHVPTGGSPPRRDHSCEEY